MVFISDAKTGAPRGADGQPFRSTEGPDGPAVALCESREAAEEFAQAVTDGHPELRGEIYDHEGKSNPPLAVVYNPGVRDRYTGVGHARRQFLIGCAFVTVGATLALIDLRHHLTFIWGYVVGLKCLILGGTFITRGVLEWVEFRKQQAGG